VTFLIVIAVCLALLGTFLQVRDWYVARQRLMADCGHRWVYFSAWREGYYWDRRCLDCPLHEPVAREDVPEEWRRRERLAGAGGPSARREGRPGRIRWPRDSEVWCDPVAGSARGSLLGRGHRGNSTRDEGECRIPHEDGGSRRTRTIGYAPSAPSSRSSAGWAARRRGTAPLRPPQATSTRSTQRSPLPRRQTAAAAGRTTRAVKMVSTAPRPRSAAPTNGAKAAPSKPKRTGSATAATASGDRGGHRSARPSDPL
jgi:hypothetical protein